MADKKYKLGDKYSPDFDYDGMLAMCLKANVSWGAKKLDKLSRSLEDVNYATINKPLYKAIKDLEVGDKDAAALKISEFHYLVEEEMSAEDEFVLLESVGSAFNPVNDMVYPLLKDGSVDTNEGVAVHISEVSDEWRNSLSEEDKVILLEYPYWGNMAKGGVAGEKWIKGAIKHKGALRKTAKKEGLIKGDEKLSMRDLKKLEKEGGKTGKRAHLAETLKTFAQGGIVANEILSNLGGMNRLHMMTGAYNFIDLTNGLSFKIKNAKANFIKITYTSLDLYDIEVGRIRGNTYKVVTEVKGAYADMLKPVIERATGMYLSLADGGEIEFKFKFKTRKDYEAAENKGYIDTFDMVRIVAEFPNGDTVDYPVKSKEEYEDELKDIPERGMVFKSAYQSRHSFDINDFNDGNGGFDGDEFADGGNVGGVDNSYNPKFGVYNDKPDVSLIYDTSFTHTNKTQEDWYTIEVNGKKWFGAKVEYNHRDNYYYLTLYTYSDSLSNKFSQRLYKSDKDLISDISNALIGEAYKEVDAMNMVSIPYSEFADGGEISSADKITARNWWNQTLSFNEEDALIKKYAPIYFPTYMRGVIYGKNNSTILEIWEKEGSPTHSEYLEKTYGYGDLADKNLWEKLHDANMKSKDKHEDVNDNTHIEIIEKKITDTYGIEKSDGIGAGDLRRMFESKENDTWVVGGKFIAGRSGESYNETLERENIIINKLGIRGWKIYKGNVLADGGEISKDEYNHLLSEYDRLTGLYEDEEKEADRIKLQKEIDATEAKIHRYERASEYAKDGKSTNKKEDMGNKKMADGGEVSSLYKEQADLEERLEQNRNDYALRSQLRKVTDQLNALTRSRRQQDEFADGGEIGISKAELLKQIKDDFKVNNKWHFINETVEGKNVQIKFFVGAKEVDVQIFKVQGSYVSMPKNYAGKRETMAMFEAAINKFEDGGSIMARGGFVSKGELVWGKLTSAKKSEFLYENFTSQITPRSQETLVGKSYRFLPKEVKIKLESKYANEEEYADGGQIRKIKGGNLEAQIENRREFTKLIKKVVEGQPKSDIYPEEFIRQTALTKHSIVKHDGKNYVKGYSRMGSMTDFPFLNNPNFVEALKYVDRPVIRKMEDGGEINSDLEKFNIKNLDTYETMEYNRMKRAKMSKSEALQIIINSVEGDYSQLSPELAKIAEAQDGGSEEMDEFDFERRAHEKEADEFANGGSIPNNYKWKTGEDVWSEWTSNQRMHFLLDHQDITGKDYNKAVLNEPYSSLPKYVKDAIIEHVNNGQYSRGGNIVSFSKEEDKHKKYWGRKGTRGESQVKCVGSFDLNHKGNINDYYLFELDSFDKEFYSHVKLKDGEKLYRYESEGTKIGKYFPIIKINIQKGLVYFMENMHSDDDKNPVFETRGVKPMYLSLHESQKMADGGIINHDGKDIYVVKVPFGGDFMTWLRDFFIEHKGKIDKKTWDDTLSVLKDKKWAKPLIKDWKEYKKDLEVEVIDGKYVNPFYKQGGTIKHSKFRDKVNAISHNLEGKKVPMKFRKKYGERYDEDESEEAAKNIAGAMRKKYGE